MPIRPDLKALYPQDWRQISRRIRFERAQGKCERCHRPHGSLVYCLPDGRWYDPYSGCWISPEGIPIPTPSLPEMLALQTTRVVLTCAHKDHDPRNNGDENLAAWCSRCHLSHDSEHHRAQRRMTFRVRQAIGDLFSGLYTLAGYPNSAPR
jgi:hypothetical protein